MKRNAFIVFILIMIFTLTGCNSSDNEYKSLIDENKKISDKINEINSQNEELKKKQNDMMIIISQLENQLDEDATNQEAIDSFLEQMSILDSKLSDIVNELSELNNDLDQSYENLDRSQVIINEMKEEISKLTKGITKLQINEYVTNSEMDEKNKYFFLSSVQPMIDEGMSADEVIEYFELSYVNVDIEYNNDDLSTTSHIIVTTPSKLFYNEIYIEISYKGIVLMQEYFTKKDRVEFDFNAEHYGTYTVNTKLIYDNVEFASEHDLHIVSSHYNFSLLNGTLPVLMYTADFIANGVSSPTFIHLQRPTTYKWNYLPENSYKFPDFIIKAGDWRYEGIDALSKWIKELYDADQSSTFTLNIVDNYTGLAIVAFDRFEIPESSYNVNIWSDGTFTDIALNSYTNEENLLDRIEYIKNYRINTKNILKEEITYDYVNSNVSKSALAYASQMKNVNYYVPGLGGVSVKDPIVLNAINENVTTKSINDLFTKLQNSTYIDDFEYLLGTRWGDNVEDGMSYYFDSPKGKYILILGTSPAGETSNTTNKYYSFNEYLDIILDMYGNEYEIFYKGHPAYPSSQERKDLFSDEGIVELRSSIPVEILMYIYPNVYIGGYRGSSFLSSKDGQTLFFFGTESFVKIQASLKDLIDNTNKFDNTQYLFNPSM